MAIGKNRLILRLTAVLVLAMLLAGCVASKGSTTNAPAPMDYPAPVVLENSLLRCVVTPDGARMVSMSLKASPAFDPIFRRQLPTPETRERGTREFVSIGGSRLWPHASGPFMTPLLGRQYPPDETFDHGLWTVTEQSQQHLTLVSAEGVRTGLKAQRTFRLHPSLPRLEIVERVIRTKENPTPLNIHTITEIHLPPLMVIPQGKGTPFFPWENAAIQHSQEWLMVSPRTGKTFLITDAGDFSCAVYPGYMLLQRHDPALQAVLYGNSEAGYGELESKSARFINLKPGESRQGRIVLDLIATPKLDNNDAVVDFLQKFMTQNGL